MLVPAVYTGISRQTPTAALIWKLLMSFSTLSQMVVDQSVSLAGVIMQIVSSSPIRYIGTGTEH